MKDSFNEITNNLRDHYSQAFSKHGANVQGVDWGTENDKLELRYQKMLQVLDRDNGGSTLLDAGCGYGGLFNYIQKANLNLKYTGIDVSREMIEWAKGNLDAEFLTGDVLNLDAKKNFDYVVCNGILTQKLDAPGLLMDEYAKDLIKKLFALSNKGVAFNVMTTKVNFFSNNLYYKSPVEMLAWCMNEITPCFSLDHSYPLYEYTVYLYKQSA